MMIVMVALLTALSASASQIRPETVSRKAGDPIMAIVSIKSQKITLYDSDGWIFRAPVSTGTEGRETPAGIFAILQKNKHHRSNMYDDANMPHMQRITWNGIAMHGGPLPGYPASHGCVRLPFDFAGRIFNKTRIGMRVIISPDDVTPLEFSHPALLQPNNKILATAPLRVKALSREAKEASQTYKAAKKNAKAMARALKSSKASLRKLKQRKKRADAELKRAKKKLKAEKKSLVLAGKRQQTATNEVAELSPLLYAAKEELKTKVDAAAVAKEADLTDEVAKKLYKEAARETALMKKAYRKLLQRKKKTDAKLKRSIKALAAANRSKTRAVERRRKAIVKTEKLATRIEDAKLDLSSRIIAHAIAKSTLQASKIRKDEISKNAQEAKLTVEPVSIYISRATQKLYVRRNTHKRAPDGYGQVFDSSIEVPVRIRDPEEPIGTHIFTAMEHNDEGLRWTAVSIDEGDKARTALDRITIPQDVLNQIEPTALPRSSIIISDEPLSRETNYRTEFVAVLSDQPKGGFITRKKPRSRSTRGRNSWFRTQRGSRRSFWFDY